MLLLQWKGCIVQEPSSSFLLIKPINSTRKRTLAQFTYILLSSVYSYAREFLIKSYSNYCYTLHCISRLVCDRQFTSHLYFIDQWYHCILFLISVILSLKVLLSHCIFLDMHIKGRNVGWVGFDRDVSLFGEFQKEIWLYAFCTEFSRWWKSDSKKKNINVIK